MQEQLPAMARDGRCASHAGAIAGNGAGRIDRARVPSLRAALARQ
jgi:hypothetical protein